MKTFATLIFAILLVTAANAQSTDAPFKGAVLNGHPALLVPFDAHGLWYNAVELTGTDAEPSLSFYAHTVERSSCGAVITISDQKVSVRHMDAGCAKQDFEAPRTSMKYDNIGFKNPSMFMARWMELKGGGHNEKWMIDQEPTHSQMKASANDLIRRSDNRVPIYDFFQLSLQSFPTALNAFWSERNDIVRPGSEVEFSKKAAAWRILTVKPDLPEEVKRERTLAEAYLQDKDIPTAVQHYKAALKAYPTWPQGWFNLALIDGSLGNYDSASQEMKFYLELTPDAPDADAAKNKIIIWEDKSKKK